MSAVILTIPNLMTLLWLTTRTYNILKKSCQRLIANLKMRTWKLNSLRVDRRALSQNWMWFQQFLRGEVGTDFCSQRLHRATLTFWHKISGPWNRYYHHKRYHIYINPCNRKYFLHSITIRVTWMLLWRMEPILNLNHKPLRVDRRHCLTKIW